MSEPGLEHFELGLVVIRKSRLAAGVVGLTLQHPDGDPLPVWTPGAHIDLILPAGLVRQYSLCGNPADRSVLQVAVLHEPAGRGGSAYVHDELSVGERVHVRGPRNHFRLVDADRYLFIAGGIGITPLLPMIHQVAIRDIEWRLIYGGRSRTSMAFLEDLDSRFGAHVEIRPQDEYGMLDLDGLLATATTGTAIYCCGPEGLIAATEQRAAERSGVTLYTERFSAQPDERDRSAFDIELAQSGVTLNVPADRSILEVLEEAGHPVLSSCQEGTCGTCETPVLAGIVDHRDCILTDDERLKNDTMMICVSRASGDKLVLDL